MYDRAFTAFDNSRYDEALKALDEIDARQPDLAESFNLRGVIYMRQAKYDKAEVALRKALSIEPRFWNASFNLAQIPFLEKNWSEARNRFEALMTSESDAMQAETKQLIQYKILLTFVLEGKEKTVDWILNKFELAKESPALYYSNAAIAFQEGNENEAKEWLTAAGKQFSGPLNKLYAESFYEVGWMQKPAGEARVALEITSAAERAERLKADAQANFEKAERALQQRDYDGALQALDLAEKDMPNESASLNLRGEILMAQKKFDQAEIVFQKALAANPKFHEAQYNLAQIPFKQGEYGKSRERFEALYGETPCGEKNQAAQLIKLKIFLTLLLEEKDPEAQELMDQFKFTGETPALYYAQGAWEFKHGHPEEGNDWVDSARKIYSPALNIVFADSFYDLGWLKEGDAGMTPTTFALAEAGAFAGTEPTPAMRFGQAAPIETPATTETTSSAAVTAASATPALSSPIAAAKPSAAPSASVVPSATAASRARTAIGSTPSREEPPPTFLESIDRVSNARTFLFGALLFAGFLFLVWLLFRQFRRSVSNAPLHEPSEPPIEASASANESAAGGESSSGSSKPPREPNAAEAVRAPGLSSGAITAREAAPIGGPVPVSANDESIGLVVAPARATAAFAAQPVISEIAQPQPASELVLIESEETIAAPIAGRQMPESSIETPSFAPKVITTEPSRPEPITSSTMPETMTAPESTFRPPAPSVPVPQPGGALHTAVQVVFSLEIASMQLTPNFKMSALQLKPTSRVVSMRFAPSPDSQLPMNLNLNFEVVRVELSNGQLNTVRLSPSGQQKPVILTSPSVPISGLELVSGQGTAPLQLTPSHQEQASVQMAAEFKIAAIEFSPQFEVAAIVLNSTSKKVSMQLPGSSPGSGESGPAFEIDSVQLGANDELGLIQVRASGAA